MALCYRRAGESRAKAARAQSNADSAFHRAMEHHWLTLARSYELSETITQFTAANARGLLEHSGFDSEIIPVMVCALDRVLRKLTPQNRGGVLAQKAAETLLAIARQGERDTGRLYELTLAAMALPGQGIARH